MKQPPPPYYQVAMTNQMITNSNAPNQSIPMRTTTTAAHVTFPVEANIRPAAQNGHMITSQAHENNANDNNNTLNTNNEIASTSASANDSSSPMK